VDASSPAAPSRLKVTGLLGLLSSSELKLTLLRTQMIESFATEDYPGMSLYDYSVDPAPYLSMMNTALGELKSAILSSDSKKINEAIEKIKNIASNNGIFSDEDVDKNE
jgi:hypothetical protein